MRLPEKFQASGDQPGVKPLPLSAPEQGFQLQEGNNAITAHATDRATNAADSSVGVTLDTIAPVITVATPVADSWVKTPLVKVSGTVTELHLTGLWINGAQVPVIDGSFTLDNFQLSEGANSIIVQAIDRAGNIGNAGTNVTLDSTPPAAPLLNPLTTPTNQAAVTISGTAEAAASAADCRSSRL